MTFPHLPDARMPYILEIFLNTRSLLLIVAIQIASWGLMSLQD